MWIAAVCGKLKTDFRYSNTLGWNTFPVPLLTAQDRHALAESAKNILLAREAHFPATIADLYAPETMPANLRQAHQRNDEIIERIYIGRLFFPDAVRTGKNGFGMDAQIAEHRRNHPDFQTFSLQGLCLKTEKDSVHIGFSFGIPRRNNGNVHEKTFVIINLRSSEKPFAVFRRPF